MPELSDHSYSLLFEYAPVAIWHEDFSEVKQFLDELRASGIGDLTAHFSSRPEVVLECVRRVRVLQVNRLARYFYGAETQEELVQRLPDLFDEAALAIFQTEIVALAEGATSFESEVVARTLQGQERVVQMNVSVLPTPDCPWSMIVVAFTDLTERRRLENDLLQARKLESLGRFAGGVAHDLNNALTVINGYSHMLLAEAAHDESMSSGLHEIRKAGERAAGLTQQLLAFSRKQVLQPRVVNLNSIILDARNVLKTASGERVELTLLLAPDLAAAKVDPAQFYNVLLNLVLNARDAMPEGGRLEIRTANVDLDPPTAGQLHLKPGKYAVLTVTDSGEGMDEETQLRVFDPFFTTKKVGKGTGLGLSSAFGIIQQSSGAIKIDSEPTRGSSFSVYLPATAGGPGTAPAESEPPALLRGSETLLVVEDQPEVRAVVTRALRKYGYIVLEAGNPEDALRCLQGGTPSIDLVITDIMMPGMTGPQLIERMLRLTPDLRVVYISGYSDASDLSLDSKRHNVRYLQKPFAPEKLALAVRELLAGHSRPRPGE